MCEKECKKTADPSVISRVRSAERDPRRLWRHPRYWSSRVLKRFFEECELTRLTDPLTAWDRLRWMPKAVRRTGTGGGVDELPSEVERRGLELRAWALTGESAALAGMDGPADSAFENARRILERGPVRREVVAEYRQRLGLLMLRRGRIAEARPLIDQALELYGDRGSKQEAWLLAGEAHGGAEGLVRRVRSLTVEPHPTPGVARALHRYAAATIVRDLADPSRDQWVTLCSEVLGELKRLPGAKHRGRSRELRSYLPWIRGLANWGVTWERVGVKRLERARAFIERRNDRPAGVWIGLDLAWMWASMGDRAGALESLDRLGEGMDGLDVSLREAVGAARSLEPETLVRAREVAEELLPLDGLSAHPLTVNVRDR